MAMWTDSQKANREWWSRNPMTYDWQGTLSLPSGSRQWFEEIDRRFLSSAYFAEAEPGIPFGRFLKPEALSGKAVLEIGCGMGTHAALLAKAGARVTVIDLTRRAALLTRRRFDLFGLPGRIEQADCEALPFRDNAFDVIWSWGVIHHSRSTEQCLMEMTRVLRDGGRLLLMVYYKPSLVYYLHCGLIRGVLLGQLARRSLQQIYVAASDGHYARVFTKPELLSLLKPGYARIATSVVGLKAELFPVPRCSIKEWLERLTPNWLASLILNRWGSMVVVEAVKRGTAEFGVQR